MLDKSKNILDDYSKMNGIESGIPTNTVDNHCQKHFNEKNTLPDNEDHDGSDEEGNMGVTRCEEEVLEARRKWALAHFYALRPAFSVSLIIYLASITCGRGAITFRSGVIDPIRNLASLVQMESKAYTKCIHLYNNRTARHLEQLAREDRERMRRLLEFNTKTLQRAEEASNKCLHYAEKARESLNQWRKDGMEIPWKEVVLNTNGGNVFQNSSTSIITQISSCTVDKRNQTEELLGQDHRAVENQINNTLQSFVSESHNSLKIVSDYALERFDYDWDYFIMERIQPALDFLVEHTMSIQTIGIDLSYNITDIERTLQERILAIQHVLDQAREHINILQNKLEEFRGSINVLYVNYNELYNRMVKATETVSEFLPPGLSLPEVFDISGFHLADSFLPPTGLTWPELELEYADIQQVSRDVANACLAFIVKILDDAQIQASQGLRGTIQDLAQTLIEMLELKDYRPPQFQGSRAKIFDLNQELEIQSLRGEEALNWTAQAMMDLRMRSSIFHNFTIEEIETPTIEKFDYNYTEEKSTTFELLNILIPEFSFLEYVLSKIAILGDYTFLLDIFCGLIQWWKLSSMYEIGAMPNMPKIDYNNGDQERGQPQANGKILLFIAKSLLNPIFVGFLCIFSFFACLVVTFWIPHVQQMCVYSTNGTWLANNMLGPILSNIAMADGNAQYLLAEHVCYSLQNQLCTNIHMEIETKIFADKTSLQNFQAQNIHSFESLELMKGCVDASNMTAMVTEACCGLKGHMTVDCYPSSNYTCPIDFSTSPPSAYRTFSSYLESSSCSKNVYNLTLNDERHECTRLNEACHHIPCNGVNDESIQRLTSQTDCKVELWIIHSCRFWAAVVIQFMALYTICSLIYLGCRDFHWRKISPDSIGLRTHLRENGVLAKGGQLQERSRMISREIKWFERKAKLQTFIGALLLLIYIVVVLILCIKG